MKKIGVIYLGKLNIHQNKILKLSNALVKRLNNQHEDNEYNKIVQQMENYIKARGAMPVGPLIQYTSPTINENGEIDIVMELIIQSNKFLYNVETPYYMKSIIKVKNCLYVRYIGDESNLNVAYDKISVTAYEEDIELKGNSYTIYVEQQDDCITADVFMERADNE